MERKEAEFALTVLIIVIVLFLNLFFRGGENGISGIVSSPGEINSSFSPSCSNIKKTPYSYKEQDRCYLTGNIEFSSFGRYISASTYKYNYLWRVGNGEILCKLPANFHLSKCSVSPDSRYLSCLGSDSPEGKPISWIYDIRQKRIIVKTAHDYPQGFSPDGKYAVMGFSEKSKELYLFNILDGRIENYSLKTIDLTGSFVDIRALKEEVHSEWLVFLNYKWKEDTDHFIRQFLFIELYDTKKQKVTGKLDVCLGDDFDGNEMRRLFCGGNKIFLFYPKSVKIIDMEKLKTRDIKFEDELWGSSNSPCCVSTDGSLIARIPYPHKKIDGKYRFTAKVYNVMSGKMIAKIPLNWEQVIGYMAVDPDNKVLAVGFQGYSQKRGRIILYDIAGRKMIRELNKDLDCRKKL